METVLDILFGICISPFVVVGIVLLFVLIIVVLLAYPVLLLFKKISSEDVRKARQELKEKFKK